MSISVWKDYFNTKKRYEDIVGRTSEAILNANKFATPWQRQNIEIECLKMIKILALKLQTRLPSQVEILVFVRRHSVINTSTSLQNKAKSVLRKRFKQYNLYNTIHYNARAPCAIIRKIALKGLFFCLSQSKSVSRVNIHSGSDICSPLPGNCNALPRIWRPKLAEHFPSTRIAIIGIDYFAISRDCSEL